MATESIPQYDCHLPLPGQSRLELRDGDGELDVSSSSLLHRPPVNYSHFDELIMDSNREQRTTAREIAESPSLQRGARIDNKEQPSGASAAAGAP